MNFFELHDNLGFISKKAAKVVAVILFAVALSFPSVRVWLLNQATLRAQQRAAPITQAYMKAADQSLENLNKSAPPK